MIGFRAPGADTDDASEMRTRMKEPSRRSSAPEQRMMNWLLDPVARQRRGRFGLSVFVEDRCRYKSRATRSRLNVEQPLRISLRLRGNRDNGSAISMAVFSTQTEKIVAARRAVRVSRDAAARANAVVITSGRRNSFSRGAAEMGIPGVTVNEVRVDVRGV